MNLIEKKAILPPAPKKPIIIKNEMWSVTNLLDIKEFQCWLEPKIPNFEHPINNEKLNLEF